MSMKLDKITIEIEGYQCERCGHAWTPRKYTADQKERPKACPKCKSPYWDTPKQ